MKHPLHFPENAIKFCDTMVDLLKVQADVFNPTTAKELAEICTALNRIQELKNNYHIVVPLSDYLQVFFQPSYSFHTANCFLGPKAFHKNTP